MATAAEVPVRVSCPGNRLVRGPFGGLAVYCGWSGKRRPENVGRPCPRCGDRVVADHG